MWARCLATHAIAVLTAGVHAAGDPTWLTAGDAPAEDVPLYTEHLPIVYVLMGAEAVPLARAIIDLESSCPTVEYSGGLSSRSPPAARVRGFGTAALPYSFPVQVCEARLPSDIDLPAGTVRFGGRVLPEVRRDPSRYVLLGDTGLRIEAKQDGFCGPGKARGTKVYDVHQCTDIDTGESGPASGGEFVAEDVLGRFQSLSDWHLYDLATLAAQERPHYVVHVGDLLYRQSVCPSPNSKGAACSSIMRCRSCSARASAEASPSR